MKTVTASQLLMTFPVTWFVPAWHSRMVDEEKRPNTLPIIGQLRLADRE